MPVDVADLIRLAEFREHTDSVAASAMRSAAAEILRLRLRQSRIAHERDEIRAHLVSIVHRAKA